MKNSKYISLALSLLLLAGCAQRNAEGAAEPITSTSTFITTPASTPTELSATVEESGELFTARDLSGEWDESKSVSITLQGNTAESDSDAVRVSGSTVTITAAGVYVLTGTLEGSVVVECSNEDKVQLVLNGVDIHCSRGAGILVEQADKVFITLPSGTENRVESDGFDESGSVDAAIFSRDDLTCNGAGALTVSSPRVTAW